MTRIATRGFAAIALAVVGMVSAPAAAEDGHRLARACVQEMIETTDEHVDRDRKITHRTVRAIRMAADSGATPHELTEIASNGKSRIDAVTEHGKRGIHHLAMRCLNKLEEIGASDDLKRAVRHGAMRSFDRLTEASDRSRHAISKALADALP